MGSDNILKGSNNLAMQAIGNLNLSELYGDEWKIQQEKLKAVFTVIDDNNVSANEKAALMAKAETLQDKVERLEAKMAVLEEEMAKSQAEIDREAAKITALFEETNKASKQMQEEHESEIKNITEYLLGKISEGRIGPDDFPGEMNRLLKNNARLNKNKSYLEDLLEKLDSKQAEVANLVTNADRWIRQRNILKAQYGSTKSTYDLINLTVSRIGNNSATYTNTDYNNAAPVYSPDKLSTIAGIIEELGTDVVVEPTNSAYDPEGKAPTLYPRDEITNKYKDCLGVKRTASDGNSYSNDTVKALKKALNMNGDGTGLIEDLSAAGFTRNEMLDFIAENFSGANIHKISNGLSVPYGHGSDAQSVFSNLIKKVKDYNRTAPLNTWDKDQGNTIKTNKQLESLSNNYTEIFDKMHKAGFTFKEAMYAMFDSNVGLFSGCGVEYDAKKQGELPNYSIDPAGDLETLKMYEDMSDLIFKYWGVKPSGIDTERNDASPESPSISRTDPFSFNMGNINNTFTFFIDKNQDGAFSDASEFVGAGNQTWLEDLAQFDADGDGKLTGEELDNIMLLNTEFVDNEAKKDNNTYSPKKGSSSNSEFAREATTNINYNMISAASLGITEIDFSASQVTQGESNEFDLNGSALYNDSFTIKFNTGKVDEAGNYISDTIEVKRKDETQEYMDTVYGSVYGRASKIGLTDNQVQTILDKDYGEFSAFDNRYAATFRNIDILKNASTISEQAKEMYDRALKNIRELEIVGTLEGCARAASIKEVSGWNTIRNEIQSKDPSIDMVIMKGIYVYYGDISADSLIEKYYEMKDMDNELEARKALDNKIWTTLTLANKEGLPTNVKQVEQYLLQGDTPDDIVERLKKASYDVDMEYVTKEIGFDSQREQEIYETLNRVFEEKGYGNKVVEALAMLCEAQQNDDSYMPDKSAEDLANNIMQKMGLK